MSDTNQNDNVEIPKKKERAPRKRILGVGIVKAVTSGDSLVLMGGVCKNGIPSQKFITLSDVVAPSFARTRSAEDEDFAFASREHLRKKCIGKRVRFVIHYVTKGGDRPRNYADVFVDHGINLGHYMLRSGMVKVKLPNNPDAKIHPEKKALMEIMEAVQQQGLGMWSKHLSNQRRDVNWDPDPRTLLEANRGRQMPAIVEQVRDGNNLRVSLLGPNLSHTMVNLLLAGVDCPRVPKPYYILKQEWERDGKKGEKPKPQRAEKFAVEAQFYSEARLLNREVRVQLLGIDKLGNFFGNILFPLGNIAVKLLENGLGRLIEWSAKLNDDTTYHRYLRAEREAKSRRLRRWANWKQSDEPVQVDRKLHSGTVVRVPNGESLEIQTSNGVTRVQFASLRAPRLGFRGLPDEPYAMDAREFVRNLVIGQRVSYRIEYERSNRRSPDRAPNTYCTVTFNNQDIGEELLARGLATIQRHRPTETRSSRYEKLMMAEERAVKLQKGQYAKHLTVPPMIADHTRNNRRRRRTGSDDDEAETARKSNSEVRKLLPYLTRKKSINCVCEYVFSGSRLKLYLPEHSCLVSFIIAGVRTPRRPDRKENSEEPQEDLNKFVTEYVTNKLTHRNVRITVNAADRGDNLIGTVFLGKLNLGLHLVQKGYGSVFSQSSREEDRDNQFIQELFSAQRQAKNKRIGIWKNWTPPERLVRDDEEKDEEDDDEEDMTSAQPLKKGQEYINVKITEINDPGNFYIQIVGEDKLAFVEERMAAFSEDIEDAPEDFEIEKGQVYAGKFNADNLWYRVRSEGRTARNTQKVLFMDYGNRSELKIDQLRPLPAELRTLKPLARNCCLAGLKTPIAPDYKEDSIYRFGDLCFNRQLLAKVEMLEKGGKLHLTLLESQSSDSINIQLLRDGVLRVEDRIHPGLNNQMVNQLRENQELAKRDNLGVWEWGDVSDSEGEESRRNDGRVPRRKF